MFSRKLPRNTVLRFAQFLLLVPTALGLDIHSAAAQAQEEPCWPVLIEIFATEDSSAHLPMTRALERLATERGPGRVIPLEYHIDDQYAVPGSEARRAAWEVRYVPTLVGRVHPPVTTDEDTAYQDLQLSLLQLGRWFPPPTLEVDVSRSISDGRVALQAQIENRGESSVADLQVIFVLYEDLGRDGYRFVVRDVSSPRSVVRIETGARIEISAELSLLEDASHDRVEAVALVQKVVGSVQSPLRVLAAGTTATAYSFPPPVPEESPPTAGVLQQPAVMDLRAILTRLRPWLAGAAAFTILLFFLAPSVRPQTFRYALRSLLGRADRTALLLLGVLAASLGVSLLSSVTEAAQVRVGRELAAYWRTTYDLLVRPAGSRSLIEGQYNLLEAHYESGLTGGITIAQYEAIKALPEVEVVAPLAAIGYVDLKTGIRTRPLPAGIYRVERTTTVDNGIRTIPLTEEQYFLAATEIPNPTESPFDGWLALQGQAKAPLSLPLGVTGNTLLVGIDPEAEAALVGLQNATLEGRYFTTEDRVEGEETGHVYPDGRSAVLYDVPVLINAHPYISFTVEYTLSRIELPTPGMLTLEALQALAHAGGREYLERVPGQVVLQRMLDAAEGYAMIFSTLGGETNRPTSLNTEYIVPSPIHYREAEMAPAEGLVLEAMPVGQWGQEASFRRQSALGMGRTSMFQLKTIGAFDLARLLEGQQLSPNAVPLETYLPPRAVLKYNEDGQPVEPVALRPTFNPGGYVTTPPLVLAPLELAELLGGPAPISCIRVRVAGIEEMGEEARARIEALAQEIVDRTGLEVDVMVGSSPQPLLVHIPGYGDVPPTGYVEELWVKKNVDTAILQNTHWTSFLVLGLTLGVCALYVVSVSYLSVLGRQGELGLLKALGWRTSAVAGLILSEQALVGGLAGAASALLALALSWLLHLAIPVEAALLMLPLGVGLCLVGGLAPAWRAVILPPAHVVQAGEVRARGRAPGRLTVAGYSSRHLLRRRGRALAAVLMLALATAMLAFMGLVTLSARRFLETTLLGQHVALEVRGYHLVVALVCALVAALTVADLTLLNARERRREMGLLRAAGWRAGDVVRLFLGEAAWIGLLGGVLGSGLALGGFAALSPTWPGATLWVVLGGLALPALVSAGAAWYPAWAAAGELPVSSLNELPRQRPAVVERRQAAVRLAAGLAVAALAIGGLAWWRMQVPSPVPAAVAVPPPATTQPAAILTRTVTPGPPVEPAAVHPAEAAVESLRVYQVAQALMEMGEREPGSDAAREAADYVAEALASYGLAVEREEVTIPPLASARNVALRVGGVKVIPQSTAAHLSTLAGGVLTAPLRLVAPAALPPVRAVEGQVLAVTETAGEDGTLPGLAALLTAYPPEALTAAMSLRPGDTIALQDALVTAEGEATLTFEGWYRREGGRTENIVATLPGTAHPEEEIWLVAVRNAEGWEPDADGGSTTTALLLELARVFSRQPLTRTIRFVSLGSEQARRFLSSRAFLQAHQGELERVIAVLDLGTVTAGEYLLFGFRQAGQPPWRAIPPSLIDLDNPDALASGLARLRGETVGLSPNEVETPGWLLEMGQAVADELGYPLAQVAFRGSELAFMQAGLPAARLAWGMEDGMPDLQAEPLLRVDRLEKSAALAYALVGHLAEEGRGE